jgi:hypothetical protein
LYSFISLTPLINDEKIDVLGQTLAPLDTKNVVLYLVLEIFRIVFIWPTQRTKMTKLRT